MKSNFYEKVVPIENENKRKLLDNISKLLDESIDTFINLRQRQQDELNNTDLKSKLIKKYIEFESSQRNQSRNNNSNNVTRIIRQRLGLNNAARHERIRNLEEETENLYRLIENNNIEEIG